MFTASFPYQLERTRPWAGALFLLALLAFPANAFQRGDEDQPAIVAGIGRIVDGDTLAVGRTRVRLEGIDAPEIAQTCQTATGETWDCGVAAAAMLRKLAEHKDVACDRSGFDRYRRTLATCFADGIDIDEAMVRVGLAWAFIRYSVVYVGVEAEARKAKIGVWQGAAEAPWISAATNGRSPKPGAPKGCAIKGNVLVSRPHLSRAVGSFVRQRQYGPGQRQALVLQRNRSA